MGRIVIRLSRQVKRHFRRTISKVRDARFKTRYMILLRTAEGYGRRTIAEMLLCSSATVDRVRNRYRQEGELGLIGRRGDNGPARVDDDYVLALINAVERTPLNYGYCSDNMIERCFWRDLHANVTRNHKCQNIDEPIREVRRHRAKVNRSAAA